MYSMNKQTPNGNQMQMQPEYKQPPVWFDLSEIDPNQALIDIRKFTGNFARLKDQDFKAQFDENINRHFGAVNKPVIIGYIPAPPQTNNKNIDVVKKVIGANGYWLKKTTENSGVHMIWYDMELNNFLFWAPNRFTISRAMKAIRWRLIKFYEHSLTQTTPVTSHLHDGVGDSYVEFPPLPKYKYNHDGDWETGLTNVTGFPKTIVHDLNDEHRTLQPCSIKLCTRCFTIIDPSDINNMCLSCSVDLKATITKRKRICDTPSPPMSPYPGEAYGCTCYGDKSVSCRACWRDLDLP